MCMCMCVCVCMCVFAVCVCCVCMCMCVCVCVCVIRYSSIASLSTSEPPDTRDTLMSLYSRHISVLTAQLLQRRGVSVLRWKARLHSFTWKTINALHHDDIVSFYESADDKNDDTGTTAATTQRHHYVNGDGDGAGDGDGDITRECA